MYQRDFILRMIERFGQILIALRNRILGGADEEEVEAALQQAGLQAGVDLNVVRSVSLDSLLMLVGSDGDIELDRAWLMAELLLLDGLHAARIGEAGNADASLTKARALYDLIGPSGAMLTGIPDLAERIAEVDRTLEALPSPAAHPELGEGRKA